MRLASASKIAPYIPNPFLQRVKISGQILLNHDFLPFFVPRNRNGPVSFFPVGHLSTRQGTGHGMTTTRERRRPACTGPGTALPVSPTSIEREWRRCSPSSWIMRWVRRGWLSQESHRNRTAAKRPRLPAACSANSQDGEKRHLRAVGRALAENPVQGAGCGQPGIGGGRCVGGKRMRVGRPRSRGMPVGGEATSVAPPTRAW